MNYLHTNDIFHRDLRTDNILLTGDNKIKITDLGIAIFKGVLTDPRYAKLRYQGKGIYVSGETSAPTTQEELVQLAKTTDLRFYSIILAKLTVCGQAADFEDVKDLENIIPPSVSANYKKFVKICYNSKEFLPFQFCFSFSLSQIMTIQLLFLEDSDLL